MEALRDQRSDEIAIGALCDSLGDRGAITTEVGRRGLRSLVVSEGHVRDAPAVRFLR